MAVLTRLFRSATFHTLFLSAAVVSFLSAQTPSVHDGMGAIQYDGGVAFRVWAPNAEAVSVVGSWNGWNPSADPMAREGDSDYTWSTDVDGIGPGYLYKFHITYDGNALWRKDPRSIQVENSATESASIIPDLDFTWEDGSFQMPAWDEMVIYQVHVGTFYDSPGFGPGNFTSAKAKLDHVKDLGVNVIQLMPVFEFAGDFSKGYNPALPFAIETAYGTPKQLMDFINEAHKRGLAVTTDVVHNHWGPSDLVTWQYDGASFGTAPENGGIYHYNDWRAETPWGHTRPDYSRAKVREYILDNTLYLLDVYHFDGLRWDSTGNIYATEYGWGPELDEGREMLQWINNEVDATQGWKPMIAEDFAKGDWVTQPTSTGGLGFDTQWSGGFVHPVRAAVIAADDVDRNMWDVHDAIYQNYNGDAFHRVIYTESHDETSNGRSRLPEEIWPGQADSYYSRKRSTLAAALLMATPGIPMLFQGQEFLEDEYFRDDDPLDWTKLTTFDGVFRLYQDIVQLRRNWYDNTRGLQGQSTNVFHVNDDAKVIAMHRWDQGGVGDDVVIIANFSSTTFPVYDIGFPQGGTWYTIFNSDSAEYGDDYTDVGDTTFAANGGGMHGFSQSASVALGPYSVYYYSQDPIPAQPTPTPTPSPSPTPSPTSTPVVPNLFVVY